VEAIDDNDREPRRLDFICVGRRLRLGLLILLLPLLLLLLLLQFLLRRLLVRLLTLLRLLREG
jgi:hypothetical protein